MSDNSIRITYTIDDGYAGGSRPFSFHMEYEPDFSDLTDEELSDHIADMALDDYRSKHSVVIDTAEAVSFMREAALREENNE